MTHAPKVRGDPLRDPAGWSDTPDVQFVWEGALNEVDECSVGRPQRIVESRSRCPLVKRISETDCKPPVVETSSPMPVTSRIGLARPGLADTVVSCDALYSSGAASYRRGHYLTKAVATGGPTTPNGVLCRRLAPLPSQFHCELLPTYLYVLACSRVDFTSLSDVECAVSSRWSSPGCDGLRRKNVEQARVAALHALFMCLELATEKIRNRFHSAIYSRLCLPSISVEVPDGF